MLHGRILRDLILAVIAINLMLIGLFVFVLMKQPDLLPRLMPGQFGAALSPDLSGNMLFLSLLLLANAALFLIAGLWGTLHAMFSGLRVSPKRMREFLKRDAGLASDISGVVAAAVQEEEKAELSYIEHASWILRIGLVLLIVALPAVCISYTHADGDGPRLFALDQDSIANSDVQQDSVLRFTADQTANAVLLGLPASLGQRFTALTANPDFLPMTLLAFFYRVLIGLAVLLSFAGMARARALRAFAMETAMPVRDIVAMQPMLAEGHGHTEHHHEPALEESHGHEDSHGHDNHGHGDRARDETSDDDSSNDAGDDHGDRGHDRKDHGQDDHAHDDHGDHDKHAA